MKQVTLFLLALCAAVNLNAAVAQQRVAADEDKKDTVEINTTLYNVLDNTSKNGVWMIQAVNYEMSEYEVVVVVQSKTFVGEYTEKEVLIKGNNDAPLTCLYLINTEKKSDTDDPFITIKVKSGHGSVTDKGSIRTFNFYLDGEDDKVYHLLASYEWFTFEGFDADEDYNHNFSSGYVWAEDGGLAVMASDTHSQMGLIFYPAEMPATPTVPVGTYTFSADKTPGTVLSSLGVDKIARTLVPSYVATLDADRNADKMWFLVSGKAIVEENDGGERVMTIDALNSMGKRVQASINLPRTALKDINVDPAVPQKFLYNGRIVIQRGGVFYDMQGNVVE